MLLQPRPLVPFTRGGIVPFKPSFIADLGVWLHPESSVFQDTAGTTPATANGDPVRRWNNDGSIAVNALESTNAPTLQLSQINSRRVVRFDGLNDLLRMTSITLPTFITVFHVSRFTNAKPLFIEQSNSANVLDGFFFYGTGSVAYRTRRGSTNVDRGAATNWLGSASAIGTAVYDGAAPKVYKNGVDAGTTTTGTLTNTNATDTLFIASRAGTGLFGDGDLAELLIYTRALTPAELNAIGSYLSAKYGIAWATI